MKSFKQLMLDFGKSKKSKSETIKWEKELEKTLQYDFNKRVKKKG